MKRPLDPVRIFLTYLNGITAYEPPATRRPISRWYANWIIANEIAPTGCYVSKSAPAGTALRRVFKCRIVSI